jgi:hypothetical protein
MQFAASVASFGMILRGSQHRGSGNVSAVLEIATTSLGDDAGGYRAEFVDLVRKAQASERIEKRTSCSPSWGTAAFARGARPGMPRRPGPWASCRACDIRVVYGGGNVGLMGCWPMRPWQPAAR